MGRTWKKNNLSLQAKNPSFNIKIPVKIVQASKNSKKYQATVASTSVCTIPDLCALTFWILLEISISQSRPMESKTNNKTFWVLIHTKQSNIYSYFFHFTIFQIDNWDEIETETVWIISQQVHTIYHRSPKYNCAVIISET